MRPAPHLQRFIARRIIAKPSRPPPDRPYQSSTSNPKSRRMSPWRPATGRHKDSPGTLQGLLIPPRVLIQELFPLMTEGIENYDDIEKRMNPQSAPLIGYYDIRLVVLSVVISIL